MRLNWTATAPGIGAFNQDHNGWTAHPPGGSFHISPPLEKYGAWRVMYAAENAPVRGHHDGLWHDVGIVKTAASAKKMAAEWYAEFVQPVSKGPMTVGRGGVVNQNPIIEARELFLYSLNNRDIYKLSQAAAMSPRGDWGAVARLAAKEYSAEHGSGPTKWREIFTLDDTRVVASMLREHYTELGDVSANPTPRLKRYDQDSQREHFNPKTGKMTKRATARLKERRTQTHYNAPPGVWANPLVRVKVKSPAQRGKAAPSERLIARRKTTQKAPPGFYANPANGFLYCVWRMDANGQPAYFMRAERTLKAAKAYAQSLADKAGLPYGIVKKPL